MKVRARLFTAAMATMAGLVVSSFGACTPSFWNRNRGWTSNKTPNVTLYAQSQDKYAHQTSQEELEVAYTALSGTFFRYMPRQNVDVLYMQQDPGRFGTFYTPLDDAPLAWSLETVPSHEGIGKDGLIVLRDENPRAAAMQMAYQFVVRAFPKAPMWFHVGFTYYLSTYRVHYLGNETVACFGADRGLADVQGITGIGDRDVVGRGPAIEGGSQSQLISATSNAGAALNTGPGASRFAGPLDNGLFGGFSGLGVGSLTPGTDTNGILKPVSEMMMGDWYAHADKDGRRYFNRTAFATISYLVHGANGVNNKRFTVFLSALSKGRDVEDALREAYPFLLPNELEQQVKNFAYAPVRPVDRVGGRMLGLCFHIPSVRYARSPAERSNVTEKDIDHLFGDLERLPLFHEYSSFYPEDVIDAKAAAAGVGNGTGAGSGSGNGPGKGTGSGAGGTGTGGTGTGSAKKPVVPPGTPDIELRGRTGPSPSPPPQP